MKNSDKVVVSKEAGNRKRVLVDSEGLETFARAMQKAFGIEATHTRVMDNGDYSYTFDGYEGNVLVKVKSGYVVCNLKAANGKEVVFKKRFSSVKAFKDVTIELFIELKETFDAKVAKKPAKKVEKKPEKPAKAEKTGKVACALRFMAAKIENGISHKQLIKDLIAEFPETSKNTFYVQLYKAMKKDTCQFDRLVVKAENGLLHFA